MNAGKIFVSLCFIFITLVLSSCLESKLEKTVKDINQECPLSLGTVGKMMSVTFEDGNIVMSFNINENFININALNENPELFKDNAIAMCQNATGDMQTLISLLGEENAGMVFKYKGVSTGKTATVAVSRQDIVDASNISEDDKNPMVVLKGQIEVTNAQLPMQVTDGMTITKLTIEGWYVFYDVQIDETLYSIETLEANMTEVKKNIVSELKKPDASVEVFLDACKKADKGIAYRYIGDVSGEECVVKIPVSEL